MRLVDFLYGSTNLLRKDDRFNIDEEFFNRFLKYRSLIKYDIDFVRLGDIQRKWNGDVYSLSQVAPYKYLKGDIEGYKKYCRYHQDELCINMSENRFDNLISSLENAGYDPKKSIIVLGYDNVIIDGQHRLCCLFHKFGPDYKVCVLRLAYNCKNCWWWKLLNLFD